MALLKNLLFALLLLTLWTLAISMHQPECPAGKNCFPSWLARDDPAAP